MKKLLFPVWIFCSSLNAQRVSFTLGGDFSRGNLNIANLDFRGEVSRDTGRISWNLNGVHRLTYLTKKNEILNNESYLTFFAESKTGKWKILLFNENERSFNRKINYRGNLGAGFSYHLVQKENLKIDISEALLPEVFLASSAERWALRVSTRLKILHKKGPVTFSSITVVQPSLLNQPEIFSKNNFVMRSQNFVEVAVSKKVSLVTGVDVVVQTYPAYLNPEVEKTDMRFYTSLKVKL